MSVVRRFRWLIAIGIVVGGIAILHPWRVVPLNAEPAAADTQSLNAIWDTRVAGAVAAAVPVNELSATAPAFVRSRGRVENIDRTSRNGRMRVQDETGGLMVSVQIGPVLRGSALRDALGLSFSDFANQVDYANAARALNERAVANVDVLNDASALEGKRVVVIGAARREGDYIDLVPVSIEVLP